MKAVVQTRYGAPEDVLELRDVPIPEPKDDEVLVRVCAASVHADVWHVVRGLPYVLRLMGSGLVRPRDTIPGTDFAGVVEATGKAVDTLVPGDAVFGESRRGMQWRNGGTFAEYVSAPHEILAPKPANVSFEEAACVPTAGYIALANLPGEAQLRHKRVLVNGAGGGVGAIAVQIAKARGAFVTAVDRGDKLDMLAALGADALVDYTQEDCLRRDEKHDFILDVASTLPFSRCKSVLSPDGIYVVIGHDHYGTVGRRVLGSLPLMFALMARAVFDRHLPRPSSSLPDKAAVMHQLGDLLETQRLKPAVGRVFPLDDVVGAIRELEQGHVPGKILLRCSNVAAGD
jgi:NADPH:quinone reductase-like Zn-dependent oxidoreductase